eukprot:3297042-Amphidinium_carterae.1
MPDCSTLREYMSPGVYVTKEQVLYIGETILMEGFSISNLGFAVARACASLPQSVLRISLFSPHGLLLIVHRSTMRTCCTQVLEVGGKIAEIELGACTPVKCLSMPLSKVHLLPPTYMYSPVNSPGMGHLPWTQQSTVNNRQGGKAGNKHMAASLISSNESL